MLNRFYYMQDDHRVIPDGLLGSVPVAHVVYDKEEGVWRRLLRHHYSKEGNYPFCIVIGQPARLVGEQLSDLLLLCSHPFYDSRARGKTIFICGEAGEDPDTKRLLEMYFSEQEQMIELIMLCEVNHCVSATAYFQYCLSDYNPEDIFFIDGREQGGIELIGQLGEMLEELQTRHPLFFRLASGYVRLIKERDSLAKDHRLLSEERTILKELLDLSQKHNEVDHILRFYKNEYEILPLWYKRAGHILKVMMGKRSFRSLYDKSVKKYKD